MPGRVPVIVRTGCNKVLIPAQTSSSSKNAGPSLRAKKLTLLVSQSDPQCFSHEDGYFPPKTQYTNSLSELLLFNGTDNMPLDLKPNAYIFFTEIRNIRTACLNCCSSMAQTTCLSISSQAHTSFSPKYAIYEQPV